VTIALSARPYGGDTDTQAVCDLLNLCDAAYQLDDNYDVESLRVEFANPRIDQQRDLRLWEDGDGRLVGFGQLWIGDPAPGATEADASLYMRVHPEARGPLDDEVLAWAEARVRELGRERGLPPLLRSGTADHYAVQHELLKRHGYEIERYFFTMERQLDLPIPEAALPEGYRLFTPQTQDDHVRWLDAFNMSFIDHWNHHPASLEEHMHWIGNEPYYRGDLTLLAEAPDGQVAAFCFCFIHTAENERNNRLAGWIASLGTRRGFRKLGLGRNMLLLGMQRLKAEGMRTARLGVDAENPSGALRLYESVGFEPIMKRVSYAKRLG
jgi:mycothiol synthase